MKKNAVAIILVVVIVGALGYFVAVKKPPADGTVNQYPMSTSTPTSSSEQFSSAVDESPWKTYRNEKLGIEFKYPGNYFISSSSPYNPNFYIAPISLQSKEASQLSGLEVQSMIHFTVIASSISTFKNWFENMECYDYKPGVTKVCGGSYKIIKDYTISGKPAVILRPALEGDFDTVGILILDSKALYEFKQSIGYTYQVKPSVGVVLPDYKGDGLLIDKIAGTLTFF